MTLAERIKTQREARGWSQLDLARQTGLSQTAINKVESGATAKSRFLPDIARALGIPLDQLMADAETNPVALVAEERLFPEAPGAPDFPIYAAREAAAGEMMVTTQPLDWVPRPWFLGAVRNGFGVLLTEGSMEPAFAPGDTVFVNPRLPPVKEKTVLLTDREGPAFRAILRRLLGFTGTEWHVRQFHPPRDAKLSRQEWPHALRVVGKLEG